jgi:hypothetical protein
MWFAQVLDCWRNAGGLKLGATIQGVVFLDKKGVRQDIPRPAGRDLYHRLSGEKSCRTPKIDLLG